MKFGYLLFCGYCEFNNFIRLHVKQTLNCEVTDVAVDVDSVAAELDVGDVGVVVAAAESVAVALS